jgi:hypothetical protein
MGMEVRHILVMEYGSLLGGVYDWEDKLIYKNS